MKEVHWIFILWTRNSMQWYSVFIQIKSCLRYFIIKIVNDCVNLIFKFINLIFLFFFRIIHLFVHEFYHIFWILKIDFFWICLLRSQFFQILIIFSYICQFSPIRSLNQKHKIFKILIYFILRWLFFFWLLWNNEILIIELFHLLLFFK